MPTNKPRLPTTYVTEKFHREFYRMIDEKNITASDYIRRAVRNQIIADGGKIEDEMPVRGTYSRDTIYRCLWCGHEQHGSIECAQCGEEEFTIVSETNQQ